MELTGKIIVVQEAKSGMSSKTGNIWMKQEYVLEMPGQFLRHCAFTVFGEDQIKQLNIQKDEELTIEFDFDAHEYNGRWYNDFRAYNVIRGNAARKQESMSETPAEEALTPFPPMPENEVVSNTGSVDDLPF